ncbi:gag/pol protein [Cucumis melo var. makuwa]|uniref:Gag/pol protein n=1 Tax=Cucumis melo var. makuwa TaxID=1194695 RepID=A0A5D3CUK8_CUCMM|nr:gag/pol protein [Cucumis melo var. makuwa]TYK14086.1 gag/pol protein [Cucumis melo var. makuwa]
MQTLFERSPLLYMVQSLAWISWCELLGMLELKVHYFSLTEVFYNDFKAPNASNRLENDPKQLELAQRTLNRSKKQTFGLDRPKPTADSRVRRTGSNPGRGEVANRVANRTNWASISRNGPWAFGRGKPDAGAGDRGARPHAEEWAKPGPTLGRDDWLCARSVQTRVGKSSKRVVNWVLGPTFKPNLSRPVSKTQNDRKDGQCSSNEYRTLVRCQKLLTIHFSEGNILSLRTSSARLRKMRARMPWTQFFHRGVKNSPTTVSLFCVVLVIGASNFGTHTPRTSVYILGIVPHLFFQSICRDASSLEGELRCHPKRSKRWPMLFQRVTNAHLVSETTEMYFSKGNRLSLRTSSVCPRKGWRTLQLEKSSVLLTPAFVRVPTVRSMQDFGPCIGADSLRRVSAWINIKKHNGDNYVTWKSNLSTILVVDDLRFALTEERPQASASNANRNVREVYDRWVEANEKACVYILASMSDVLAKKHESLAMAKEIMDSLREMFVNGGHINEANQVSFILHSFPKSFVPFQTNASLNKIEFTLTTLLNELQRFQNLTKGKGKEVETNVATTEKELVGGSSSKTRVGTLNMKKKRKGKTPKNSKGKKVAKSKCYHCNEDGHWLRNCPKYLAEKKAEKDA